MSHRPKMLASEVREIIAPVLRAAPPECGIVSITEVEISADFQHATVYISALKEPKKSLGFLESRSRELQKKMGGLGVHHIPMLRFRLDERGDRGEKIDRLLENLHIKDSEDSFPSQQG